MATEGIGSNRLAATNAVGAVWWYFLIRGLLLLGAGLFLLLKPTLTVVAFAQLIGAFLLVDGILAIVAGIMGRAESRLWSFVRGALLLMVGLFILLQPALAATIAAKTVFYVVAPFIIIAGILEIVSAVRARKARKEAKGSILNGLLTTIFGILLIIAPLFFGKLVLLLIAVWAIIFSLLLLVLAFKARKLSKLVERSSPAGDS